MTNNLEFKQLFPKVKFKKRKFKFSQNQVDFLKLTLKEETKLMFLAGPAGTAKTYMAVYCALQAMMDSDFEKIILYTNLYFFNLKDIQTDITLLLLLNFLCIEQSLYVPFVVSHKLLLLFFYLDPKKMSIFV